MPYSCPKFGKIVSLKASSSPSISFTSEESLPSTPPTNLDEGFGHNSDGKGGVSPKKPFFIFDDEDDDDDEEEDQNAVSENREMVKENYDTKFKVKTIKNSPLSPKKNSYNLGRISKLSLNSSDILNFPKESTHSYSYAHLSPNSLAVRLSILKRSLEILLDRPELINRDGKGGLANTTPVNLDIANFIHRVHEEAELEDAPQSSKLIIRPNASSAALAALFTSPTPSKPLSMDENTQIGLKTLINLLREDNLGDDPHFTSKKILAENLHDLSLTTAPENEQSQDPSQSSKGTSAESELKIKLLHALATPFYEPIVQAPILSLNRGESTIALSSLEAQYPSSPIAPSDPSHNNNNNNNNDTTNNKNKNKNTNRIFNSPQKNTSPQAVFTVDDSDPWSLKAANDLACLIFGVSRTTLKRLTLLDLISPDSRDFVLNKLIANSLSSEDLIFSGEIIAIAKSGNKLTWASLWAKRKGNLIICMFDQVLCDSVDVTIDLNNSNQIIKWKKISGSNAVLGDDQADLKTIDDLIWNFDNFLTDKSSEFANNNIPDLIVKSKIINDRRYFTIKNNGLHIPCAITSKIIDENEGNLKLKLHTLPYIAGVFIISASDFKILSFNESISKNLFGFNEASLKNEKITKIVPNFIKIIDFVLKNFSNLKIIPGLVLPEHFFRQINALLTQSDFLHSVGIQGKHADGSSINIDIQLRCSNIDTLLLWVTHSRTVYSKILNETQKNGATNALSTEDEVLSSNKNETEDFTELPSQLSILDETEIKSISRSSSRRSINSSPSSSSKHSSTNELRSLTSKQGIAGLTNIDSDSSIDLTEFKVLDDKLNEKQLLKIENDTIERKKLESSKYPKVVGLRRRQKSFKEFNILKKMGQGAYGRVVLASNKEDPKYVVVIKLIVKERILVDTWVRDRKLGTIPSEIQIMATLNDNPHPNIMRLIDFFEDEDYYYIETPQHGYPTPAIDLFDYIELKKSVSEVGCKSIVKQTMSAINHLHKNGIVHRDIKDENLIIDDNGIIKLIDFGSAAYTKQGPFDVFVGTLDYAAPEVLNGQPYEGKPQDVWSLGILIYTLVFKENPYYNVDEIMEGELCFPFSVDERIVELIKRILQRDTKKRPSVEELVNDKWFSS